ncbi:hypothetical protein F7734_28220 [Scytonema sp. UIC 10036]|uniref:hypothetical protein n=1 Tax=Scytonema sp. UIC 10036 TaxID=2304196 RepID=UPI0012DACF64|nr:hypothetical protein [Scytonema sp. UIC 10036]MUG96022.1 hypothetical protein [Scytonema sp. UIC 10036]
MFFLSLEDLEIKGVSYMGESQIIFKNKILTRCIDFSIQYHQKAIKFCQEFLDDNLLCLIVENQSYLTVWVEEKEERLAGETEINHGLHEAIDLLYQVADTDAVVKTQTKLATTVHPHNSTENLFLTDEEKSGNSSLAKERGEFDSLPLSQPFTEHKPCTKKSIRKYRGLPY